MKKAKTLQKVQKNFFINQKNIKMKKKKRRHYIVSSKKAAKEEFIPLTTNGMAMNWPSSSTSNNIIRGIDKTGQMSNYNLITIYHRITAMLISLNAPLNFSLRPINCALARGRRLAEDLSSVTNISLNFIITISIPSLTRKDWTESWAEKNRKMGDKLLEGNMIIMNMYNF